MTPFSCPAQVAESTTPMNKSTRDQNQLRQELLQMILRNEAKRKAEQKSAGESANSYPVVTYTKTNTPHQLSSR